jgi:hypothetical protein
VAGRLEAAQPRLFTLNNPLFNERTFIMAEKPIQRSDVIPPNRVTFEMVPINKLEEFPKAVPAIVAGEKIWLRPAGPLIPQDVTPDEFWWLYHNHGGFHEFCDRIVAEAELNWQRHRNWENRT